MKEALMAKRRSSKSMAEPKISERYVRELFAEAGARFSSSKLARVMTAILGNKPIPPPDEKGWDAAALLITASVLVTRATAMMGKAEASSRGRRTCRKSPGGPRRS
jgi:hypothetical protein